MEFIRNVLSPSGLRSGRLTELGLGHGGAASLSGGETREDGHVSFGFSLMRGKRPNMEDFHHAEVIRHRKMTSMPFLRQVSFVMQFRKHESSGECVGVFGVFDGAICSHDLYLLFSARSFEEKAS
jgi:hypothetical protein